MLCDKVVIANWPDHLNVELLLSISESWLEDNKVVAVEIGFKVDSFSECGHFSSSEIDSALNFSGTIAEFEHVGVVFSVAILKSGHN